MLTRMNQPQPDIVGQVVQGRGNRMSGCRQYWLANIVIQKKGSMDVNGYVKRCDRLGQLCGSLLKNMSELTAPAFPSLIVLHGQSETASGAEPLCLVMTISACATHLRPHFILTRLNNARIQKAHTSWVFEVLPNTFSHTLSGNCWVSQHKIKLEVPAMRLGTSSLTALRWPFSSITAYSLSIPTNQISLIRCQITTWLDVRQSPSCSGFKLVAS